MTPLDKFEEYLKSKNATEDTIHRYREVARHFIRFYGENSKSYGDAEIRRYLAMLRDGGGHGSYLRFVMYALKAFYRSLDIPWKLEREDVPKLDPPVQKWYSIDDMKKIIDAAKKGDSLRDWLIFFVLGLTGRRRKAFTMLKRTDYDSENGILTMPSVKRGKISPIKLPKVAQRAMSDYLMKRTDMKSALFLSLRSKDGHLDPQSLNQLLTKYCKVAGLPNKGMHAFRRGLITYYGEIVRMNAKEIVSTIDDWGSETSGLSMVNRYMQLSSTFGAESREKNNPLFQEEDEEKPSKRRPVIEGREESPQERFKRLRGKPLDKD